MAVLCDRLSKSGGFHRTKSVVCGAWFGVVGWWGRGVVWWCGGVVVWRWRGAVMSGVWCLVPDPNPKTNSNAQH